MSYMQSIGEEVHAKLAAEKAEKEARLAELQAHGKTLTDANDAKRRELEAQQKQALEERQARRAAEQKAAAKRAYIENGGDPASFEAAYETIVVTRTAGDLAASKPARRPATL